MPSRREETEMMQKVVDSRPNGLRILETLECGHVIDSVTPSEEVDCMACDIEFVAATPERVLKRLREFDRADEFDGE